MPKPRCVETLGDALIRARTVEANNLSSKYWNTCVVPTSATPPIHAKENLGSTDSGVQARRLMLRQALRGERPDLFPGGKSKDGRPIRTFSGGAVLKVQKRPDPEDDWELLGEVGRRVHKAIESGDHLLDLERQAFVEKRMAEIETELGS